RGTRRRPGNRAARPSERALHRWIRCPEAGAGHHGTASEARIVVQGARRNWRRLVPQACPESRSRAAGARGKFRLRGTAAGTVRVFGDGLVSRTGTFARRGTPAAAVNPARPARGGARHHTRATGGRDSEKSVRAAIGREDYDVGRSRGRSEGTAQHRRRVTSSARVVRSFALSASTIHSIPHFPQKNSTRGSTSKESFRLQS